MADLVALWWQGLTLSPDAFVRVSEDRDARLLAYLLVLLGGASELVGQSVVLFLNQVRPWRFLLALALNALTFALQVGVWVAGLLVVEAVLIDEGIAATTVAGVVALGHAPYLLAFLLLTPYYGLPLQRVIELWTVTAIGVGLAAVTTWPLATIVAAVALGLGFRLIVKISVGRWIEGVDRWLWRTATGSRVRLRVEDGLSTMTERATADARRWFG